MKFYILLWFLFSVYTFIFSTTRSIKFFRIEPYSSQSRKSCFRPRLDFQKKMEKCADKIIKIVAENKDEIKLCQDYWSAKFPSKIISLDGRLIWDRVYHCTQSLSQQPPIQYRLNFIKSVIKQLESRGCQEEATTWYDCLENLNSTCQIQTEPFYRLYDLETDETLNLGIRQDNLIKIYEDEKAFVSEGSTGFTTWTASLELAKFLNHSDQVSSTNDFSWAFELGCGTGLLAVSLVKKFSQLKHYHATDIHSGVLQRCQANVAANKVDSQIDMTPLDWIQDENEFPIYFQNAIQKYSGPGILLGADIIFDTSVVESLRKIIQSFLAVKPEGRVFLSSTIRNEKTMESFQDEIRKNGLQIKVVHTWECREGDHGTIQEIHNFLWQK